MKKKILKKFPYEFEKIENEWLLLSDGTKLSSRLWLPKARQDKKTKILESKFPAILEYIPYRKNDGTRTRDEPMHGYFAGHGYAVIRVDMRGTGESDGLLQDEYLKLEQDDALEVIEWISKQEWCNGVVGMMGKSWGGFNSLQVAARRPKALKAIITVGFTDDRYNDDIHYKGGCLLNDNFWWGAIMQAYQSRPIDHRIRKDWKELWLKRLENMPLWMGEWMRHPTRDKYWKHGSVCEKYSDINIPVFALDGWADSYTNTVFSLIDNLDVPKKGIIGPWAHIYPHDGIPLPAYDFLGEATKWWDYHLKGLKNDIMDGPIYSVWMEEEGSPTVSKPTSKGRFVGFDSYFNNTKEFKNIEFFLDSKSLVNKKVNIKNNEVILSTPLNHGLLSGEWMGAGVDGEMPGDQRLDNGLSLCFDSETLSEDIEVLGYPVFEVELKSDKKIAQLFASLCRVSPRGDSMRISYGIVNLTHEENHSKVKPLDANKTIKAVIKLDACGARFSKGDKIRLSLATSYWPMFWVSPEIVQLKLDLNTAKLTLPSFKGSDTNLNLEPKSAPLTPLTTLKEGRVDRSIFYDILTDTWTCVTDGVGGVFGEGIYRFDEINVTVEHNLKRELSLCNSSPLSAKYTITQKMKLDIDEAQTNADIITTQSCDKNYFYLESEIIIKENGKDFFNKKYSEKIKRVGL